MRRSLILVTIAVLCALVPAVAGYDVVYTVPGEYTWTVPEGLESIDVVVVASGAQGREANSAYYPSDGDGGVGGARSTPAYASYYDLVPGTTASIVVADTMYHSTFVIPNHTVCISYPAVGGGRPGGAPGIDGLPGADGFVEITPYIPAESGYSAVGGGIGGAGGIGAGAGGGGGGRNTHPGTTPDYSPGGAGASGAVAITYHYPPPTPALTLDWSPETGFFTGLWFDRHHDFIDVDGLFGSLLMPITLLVGSWAFMIVWGTICMGLYLYTQDTTLPFVVGILLGAVLSTFMGSDAVTVMYITMAFAGAGVLAKVVLGRV